MKKMYLLLFILAFLNNDRILADNNFFNDLINNDFHSAFFLSINLDFADISSEYIVTVGHIYSSLKYNEEICKENYNFNSALKRKEWDSLIIVKLKNKKSINLCYKESTIKVISNKRFDNQNTFYQKIDSVASFGKNHFLNTFFEMSYDSEHNIEYGIQKEDILKQFTNERNNTELQILFNSLIRKLIEFEYFVYQDCYSGFLRIMNKLPAKYTH